MSGMDKDLLGYKKIVGIDIETWDGKRGGSLDPYYGKIALVQIAYDKDNIALYRPWEANFEEALRVINDKEILKVGHNLKFDLKFFYMNNIYPEPVFDTMIASQMVYAGLDEPDEISEVLEALKDDLTTEEVAIFEILGKKKTKATRFSHSLQAVLKRELDIFLPKDVQNSNWGGELSEAQKEYAINDVKYLKDLAIELWKKIKALNIEKVFMLEMKFLPVLVMLELTGVKINKDGWQQKMEKEKQELLQLEKELKKEIYEKFVSKNNTSTMIGLFEDAEYEKINLNSPLQMSKIFGLPNVSKLTLERIDDPTIKKYVEYKKKAKLVTTYSKEYLEKLTENNRLMSDYSQTKTATGRISSSNPNLQNVPSWFKRYITAEEGYIPVFADYSQVELRILAYLSGDEAMIDSCNSKDMHSENARKIYKIPPSQPVPPELRKKAKTVSFAIPYGSSAYGLVVRGMFSSVREAEEAIEGFFDSFPKVKEFLEKSAKSAQNGITRDALGRVRNYKKIYISEDEKEALKIFMFKLPSGTSKDEFIKEILGKNSFKDAAKIFGIDEQTLQLALSAYEKTKRLAKIAREGQNHPIQATSASITKTAMVDLLEYLSMTGYGYMTLTVHDSIFFEIKKEFIFDAIPKIKEIMEQAGPKVVPGIITPVDVEVGEKISVFCNSCGKEYEINRYMVDIKEKIIVDFTKDVYICEECFNNVL